MYVCLVGFGPAYSLPFVDIRKIRNALWNGPVEQTGYRSLIASYTSYAHIGEIARCFSLRVMGMRMECDFECEEGWVVRITRTNDDAKTRFYLYIYIYMYNTTANANVHEYIRFHKTKTFTWYISLVVYHFGTSKAKALGFLIWKPFSFVCIIVIVFYSIKQTCADRWWKERQSKGRNGMADGWYIELDPGTGDIEFERRGRGRGRGEKQHTFTDAFNEL